MDNLEIWDKVKRPPKDALKSIGGGRLRGMTDVNPQWRLKIMTEIYGQIGVGWKYTIMQKWIEEGHNGERCAFVVVHLHTWIDDKRGWSAEIPGIGGSMLIAKERDGLHTNDEAFKMATTDALSVAMKQLGVAADIYFGRWDGSKYKDEPANNSNVRTIGSTKPLDEQRKELVDKINLSNVPKEQYEIWESMKPFADNEETSLWWTKLKAEPRAKIKEYGVYLRERSTKEETPLTELLVGEQS